MCGEAWPRLERLAAETGLSRRTVQRALRAAEQLGWVRRRHPGYHHRRSATYQLLVGQLQLAPPPRTDEDEGGRDRRDRIGTLRNVEHRTICEAYRDAARQRYGIGLHSLPRRSALREIAQFIGELVAAHDQPFETVAKEVMRAYLRQPSGRDGRLEEACHPLPWLINCTGPVEREVNERLRRKLAKARAPTMRVEVVTAEPIAQLDGGGAAATIAQNLRRKTG